MARINTHRDLLFGLLAPQNGMLDQAQLVAAFGTWTLAKDRPMAEILFEQAVLEGSLSALLDSPVSAHLTLHGDDAEKSLAALDADRSTRERLSRPGDAELVFRGPWLVSRRGALVYHGSWSTRP